MRRGVSVVGPKVEPVLVAVAVVGTGVGVGVGVGPEAEVEIEVGIHGMKALMLAAWRKRQARLGPR